VRFVYEKNGTWDESIVGLFWNDRRDYSEGYAEVRVNINENLRQRKGVVHGGLFYALLTYFGSFCVRKRYYRV
jgi:acyl-coenzyme A thioesterase PaaI-like protein